MVEHKDIQNPEDYSAKHYAKFRYLLFSDETPREELEEICYLSPENEQEERDF